MRFLGWRAQDEHAGRWRRRRRELVDSRQESLGGRRVGRALEQRLELAARSLELVLQGQGRGPMQGRFVAWFRGRRPCVAAVVLVIGNTTPPALLHPWRWVAPPHVVGLGPPREPGSLENGTQLRVPKHVGPQRVVARAKSSEPRIGVRTRRVSEHFVQRGDAALHAAARRMTPPGKTIEKRCDVAPYPIHCRKRGSSPALRSLLIVELQPRVTRRATLRRNVVVAAVVAVGIAIAVIVSAAGASRAAQDRPRSRGPVHGTARGGRLRLSALAQRGLARGVRAQQRGPPRGRGRDSTKPGSAGASSAAPVTLALTLNALPRFLPPFIFFDLLPSAPPHLPAPPWGPPPL